jgi:hypothetical protein
MDANRRRFLERKREVLLSRLAAGGEFIRGSVVLMKRKCTRARCSRCLCGQRHPTWVLTYSRQGKTRTVYLGHKRLAEARRMVAQHRALMDLLDQVAEINLALLTDTELPARREDGGDGRSARRHRHAGDGGCRRGSP